MKKTTKSYESPAVEMSRVSAIDVMSASKLHDSLLDIDDIVKDNFDPLT